MKLKPKVYKTERAAKKFLAACVEKYPHKDFLSQLNQMALVIV